MCAYQTGEVGHPGELAHRDAVLVDRVEHDPVLVLGAVAVVARGDQHARREALDVPLPRARERLVEVVDVEHEPALGRREHAEVRQVRVAAALRGQTRAGRPGEVVRHDLRRAAVERERRDEHPAVADRNQLGDARLGLVLEQIDGIRADRAGASNSAWRDRGTSARAALPRAIRSSTVRCTDGVGRCWSACSRSHDRRSCQNPACIRPSSDAGEMDRVILRSRVMPARCEPGIVGRRSMATDDSLRRGDDLEPAGAALPAAARAAVMAGRRRCRCSWPRRSSPTSASAASRTRWPPPC